MENNTKWFIKKEDESKIKLTNRKVKLAPFTVGYGHCTAGSKDNDKNK